jgi:NADPH-ferrihemoprotein reductase
MFLFFKVFGLGNKTYEHYNAVGKYVDKRLTELGGVRVCELGLGDDDGKYVGKIFSRFLIVKFSIEDDFMAWATVFWQNVCQKYELVINADGTS